MMSRILRAVFASVLFSSGCGEPPPEAVVTPCEEEQSDYLFCHDNDAECGEFTGTDACGQVRTVDCGQCDSTCLENNRCECIPEDDQTFCERHLQSCDTYTGLDNCQTERTVECGPCAEGELCVEHLSATICRADTCNATNCRTGTCYEGKCHSKSPRTSPNMCAAGQSWTGSECVKRRIPRP